MGWPGPVTERQHRTFLAWMRLEWNRPNRSDHYLMQLARMQSAKPKDLGEYRIRFKDTEPEEYLSDAELTKRMKAAWGLELGIDLE